jgi:excisionase family DNA binding protein
MEIKVNTREAANILGISVRTVQQQAASGKLTATKVNGRWIITLPADTETDAPATITTDERIRAAYNVATDSTPGTWVDLTTIRPWIQDLPRDEQDEALRRLERCPDVNLVPESNQKTLTPARREAAVEIGLQDKHLIWIGA